MTELRAEVPFVRFSDQVAPEWPPNMSRRFVAAPVVEVVQCPLEDWQLEYSWAGDLEDAALLELDLAEHLAGHTPLEWIQAYRVLAERITAAAALTRRPINVEAGDGDSLDVVAVSELTAALFPPAPPR